MLFKKYFLKTNNWEDLTRFFHCCVIEFSACAYLENLFLLGGYEPTGGTELNQCIEFDTDTRLPQLLTPLNVPRCTAGRTVFEGKIVISGGHSVKNDLRSVEVYDYFADTRALMPNMVDIRFGHSLLAVKNKYLQLEDIKMLTVKCMIVLKSLFF